MVRNIWRLAAAAALALAVSGCSLADLVSAPAPPAASSSSSTAAGATGIVTLVGETVYHLFQTGDNQADFAVVPATGLPAAYLDGTGQVGQLDTSTTDPTIKSLNIVFNNVAATNTAPGNAGHAGSNNASPGSAGDVVDVTLYNHQGTIIGTVQVAATGAIDLSTYNAASVRLTATAAGTAAASKAPYAYLYQMTNSAGNIFTYTVFVPPS